MTDARQLVAQGYDVIAERYLETYARSTVRDRWAAELIAHLPVGGRVLDLGCGAGIPVARDLAARGFAVTGVDGSPRQIDLARRNVPAATFLCADMTAVEFSPASFDGVGAFYSLTHVPREEHAALLSRIAGWLNPGGVLVASLGAHALEERTEDWLGAPMVFSHYDAATNERLVREAGFALDRAEIMQQDNEPARFLWVVGKRLD